MNLCSMDFHQFSKSNSLKRHILGFCRQPTNIYILVDLSCLIKQIYKVIVTNPTFHIFDLRWLLAQPLIFLIKAGLMENIKNIPKKQSISNLIIASNMPLGSMSKFLINIICFQIQEKYYV